LKKFIVLSASTLIWLCVSCDTSDWEEIDSRDFDDAGIRLPVQTHAIIDGEETNYESFQAVVMVSSFSWMCTGTLIHPQVVLTAGHCVKIYSEELEINFDFLNVPERIQIRGGSMGQIVYSRAAEIRVHPSWEGSLSAEVGDLALILLKEPITEWEPFRLRDFPMPEAGESGMIVGYGGNVTVEPSTDGEEIPFGSGLHRKGLTTLRSVDNKIIETGGTTNTCEGDSGGPLFTRQNGEWVLTGVTSFGTSPCFATYGGYSVNLLAYCDWLNQTMLEFTGTDLGLEKCVTCEASTATSWGQPCGPSYPCWPDGTTCRTPEDFSREGRGYCAPHCCALGETQSANCTDVSDGDESCLFIDAQGEPYCAIACDDISDCPDGTTCKNRPYTSDKICIATEEGPGGDAICSPDSDTEEDTSSDSETEGETDSGLSRDSSTSWDTNFNIRDKDGGVPEQSDNHGSCRCQATGYGVSQPGMLVTFFNLLFPIF
jgi:hypothetical protein